MDPAGQPVFDIFTVCVQRHGARALEGIEGLNGCGEFHAIIGGFRRAAFKLFNVPIIIEHSAPATGAGVARASPIGMDRHEIIHCAAGTRNSRGRLNDMSSRAVTRLETDIL